MSEEAVVNAQDAPVTEEQEQATEQTPRLLPPYQVVILNDEDHTYPYVIEMLMKVFRYRLAMAFKVTRQIDETGKAIVWTGQKEVAELKRDQVRGYGPDFYAQAPVHYPLGVTIEPMPDA